MPRKRQGGDFKDGDTFWGTLAKDGSDADIRDLLNHDPKNSPQTVKEALRLYAAIERGEVPPQLISQWRRWAKAELARGVADIVLDELTSRNLLIAGGVPPAVQAAVREVVTDRFAETAQSEEL